MTPARRCGGASADGGRKEARRQRQRYIGDAQGRPRPTGCRPAMLVRRASTPGGAAGHQGERSLLSRPRSSGLYPTPARTAWVGVGGRHPARMGADTTGRWVVGGSGTRVGVAASRRKPLHRHVTRVFKKKRCVAKSFASKQGASIGQRASSRWKINRTSNI